MEWYWAFILLLGTVCTAMFLGLPVAFAFFGANVLGTFLFINGDIGLVFMPAEFHNAIKFTLAPIPLFLLMGRNPSADRGRVQGDRRDRPDDRARAGKALGGLHRGRDDLLLAVGLDHRQHRDPGLGAAPRYGEAGLPAGDLHGPDHGGRRHSDADPAVRVGRAAGEPRGAVGGPSADRGHRPRHPDGGAFLRLCGGALRDRPRARAGLHARHQRPRRAGDRLAQPRGHHPPVVDLCRAPPPGGQPGAAVPALHPAADDHLRGGRRQHLLQDRRAHRGRGARLHRGPGGLLLLPAVPEHRDRHRDRGCRLRLAGDRQVADGKPPRSTR